jgi:hypothetical protein
LLLLAAIYIVLNVDGHGADLDCLFGIGTSRQFIASRLPKGRARLIVNSLTSPVAIRPLRRSRDLGFTGKICRQYEDYRLGWRSITYRPHTTETFIGIIESGLLFCRTCETSIDHKRQNLMSLAM